MKNNEWMLKFKPTTYFDLREITLKDSKIKYFDRELQYELYDDGNSVPSFKIYDLYRDSCTQFDIDELPKLIKELEAAYKRYKDFKENENNKKNNNSRKEMEKIL